VAAIALAISVASFTAHLAFPIGSEQFHLQLGMFPQYVILFSLGVAAGRRGWLDTLTPELQRRCGIAGAIAAPALLASLLAGGFFTGDAAEDRFAGGLRWEAAAFPLAEGVLATCVSLWAIGYFQRRFNQLRPSARLMAPRAYGAYIVHPPVIVGLALAIQPLPLPAELKFIAVLVVGVAASFGLAALVSRAGPIARIVGIRSGCDHEHSGRAAVRATGGWTGARSAEPLAEAASALPGWKTASRDRSPASAGLAGRLWHRGPLARARSRV
jgi:acyltransferase-like protein